MEFLHINEKKIPFELKRSKRARHLRLSIHSNEPRVVLTVPPFAFKIEINHFIKKQTPWIEKHWAKVEAQVARRPKPDYDTGDNFYYFGEKVALTVRSSEKKRARVAVRDDKMIIFIYHLLGKEEAAIQVKKAIETFYKKKASEVIHDRLEHFNEYYGLKYKRVTFRKQKTRWGSCSSQKNLNFNWRLIMAPIEVIDYVVVHELCHLKEMNHSARFWSLVAEQVPDHKVRKKWLKENHVLLKV